MILRGTVMSEKRVALDVTRADRAPVAPIRSQPAASEPLVAASPPPAPVPPPPPVPAPPPPITLAAVVKWLAAQQQETRAQLAAQLADDIEGVKRAAREQGFAAGRSEGEKVAQAEAERHLALLESTRRAAQAAFETQAEELSQQCTEIVAAALTRIAGPLLATQEAAAGAVIEVLKHVKEEGKVIIRVSASDLPILKRSEVRIAEVMAGCSLVSDARVETGGAIVESTLGSLDGRFEVQLRALFDTLQAAKAARREQS